MLILPVGPVPQYAIAADMINRQRIDCRHLVTFNMDEYANDQGRTAPADWEGLVRDLDAPVVLREDRRRICGRPTRTSTFRPTATSTDYWKLIEDAGGADCCYGGIGWCGHIAFWESHLGLEFADDLAAYKQRPRPHRRAQPDDDHAERAAHLRRRLVLGAAEGRVDRPARDPRARATAASGWTATSAAGVSWQRFIARLVAHGPVNELVPGSILQETNCGYHILGGVADDVTIDFA